MNAIYFCPNCGGAAVDTPLLAGGQASCRSCGWKGAATELVAAPMPEDVQLKPEAFIREFTSDFKIMFAKECAAPVMRLLVKWGFMPAMAEREHMKTLLARYLRAVAIASVQALFDERAKIENEGREKRTDAS